MFEYKKIQTINAPISEVFTFFETPEKLEIITPKNLGFIIKTPKPLVMKKGAIFKYTIKLGLIRFPWITLITKYKPPFVFQDIQKYGPYRKWEHTHEFVDLGGKTKVVDIVEYDLHIALFKHVLNRLYVRKNIDKIFNFRSTVLSKIFNHSHHNSSMDI